MARQNKVVLVAVGVVITLAVAAGDNASGPDFDLSVLYLVPVSFFAAFLGKRTGLVASVVCTAVALEVHRSTLAISSRVAYWNALAWFMVYVFFVLVIAEIRALYDREWRGSRLDPLTGIPNRRAFFTGLEAERDRARRYGHPLSLAYIDLDHFKDVNDRLGHSTGDMLLTEVATVIQTFIRKVDLAARLGGDEFALLLPETEKAAAGATLTKLRTSLDTAMEQKHWPVTFSIGLVTFVSPPESVEEMVKAADEAMYEAKKSGRGRLVVHKPAA